MTGAGAIAAGAKATPDSTVVYLLAAIVIAAMAFGYLAWRDWHRTRSRACQHSGTDSGVHGTGSYGTGKYSTDQGDFS